MAKIEEKIFDIVKPTIQAMGYELVGIEYHASGKFSTLRIYVDIDRGINLDDCEKVSKQVSDLLDIDDPITGQYSLEVSSPGLERPLFTMEHYHRFLGHDVKIKLYRAIEGRRKFNGTIFSVSDANDMVELATELGNVEIDFKLIEKANLVPDF